MKTARDDARQAACDNTRLAYAKDWAQFARWCRMRGTDPLPQSSELIGPYIADLAAPQGRTPALSVSSIERRLSGLGWGDARRGQRLDRAAELSRASRFLFLLPRLWPTKARCGDRKSVV